ncbi:MAG: NUDIX domain-containing protein [Dehalococcoidia bacterium]
MTAPDVLEALGVGALTLARGDWRLRDDRPADVVERVQRGRPFRGGPAWRTVRTHADRVWQAAIEAGRPIYGRPPEPPGLLRLVAWQQTGHRLALQVQPTWFWSLLGSNVAIERAGGPAATLAALEQSDPRAIAGSLLCNALTVNLAVIFTGDDPPLLLIQLRGAVARRGAERYQVSAAGFVDRADHQRDGRLPSPWRAAVREAHEETGIEVEAAQIRFLSLCRSTGTYLPGFCGLVELPEEAAGRAFHAGHDGFEVGGYELWPFQPEPIFRRVIAEGGWQSFVPLGGAAVVAALCDRYGDQAVLRAWNATARPSSMPVAE